MAFWTEDGILVPALTAGQMREVDRIAVEVFGLGLLQMMENAGRNLAENVIDMLSRPGGKVTIMAGGGGNGGGGLCCGRHLHNHGVEISLVLDRAPDALGDAARNQLDILRATGLHSADRQKADGAIREADVVVDALIGYSLHGAPRGRTAELIDLCNMQAARVLSLDVPSGLDATTGDSPGVVVRPERTVTLGLPKRGLQVIAGDLYVADIGIPPEVYHSLGISADLLFGEHYWRRLVKEEKQDEQAERTG